MRLFIVLLILLTATVNAQIPDDSLEYVNKLISEKKFDQAEKILESNLQLIGKDVFNTQLLAQLYYWNDHIEKADSVYQAGIKKFPLAYFLLLDYGKMLFECGNYNNAAYYLREYLKKYPDDLYSLETLGYILYWKAEYKKALGNFKAILRQNPSNKNAKDMVLNINKIIKPYLQLNNNYNYDSQPLEGNLTELEFGFYHSPLINPVIDAGIQYFQTYDTIRYHTSFLLSNEMTLFNASMSLSISSGFLLSDKTIFTGGLNINQRLTKKLSLNFLAAREPYFFTSKSLLQNVEFDDISLSLEYDGEEGFLGMLSAGKQFFFDANRITTCFAWGLSPLIRFKNIGFRLGYAFNFSNAEKDKFTSIKSFDQLLIDSEYEDIKGEYNPYFTPSNKNVHSLLGIINFEIIRNIFLEFKGSVGFYAFADIPYLYLDNDENDELKIQKGFCKMDFTPYKILSSLKYPLSQKLNLLVSYEYTSDIYYQIDNVVFTLKYCFL